MGAGPRRPPLRATPHCTKGPLSSLQAARKGSVRWFLYVPWFCLQGKQTGPGGFPLSPGLSKAQQHSQRSPENLLPARRRCCSARLLRFRWSDLRGLHFSTRRAAAKGPLKGGASAAPGPPPLVRLGLRDWPAPRPTAFTFPSRVFPGDLGSGSRRDSAAAAGTEGGSRA